MTSKTYWDAYSQLSSDIVSDIVKTVKKLHKFDDVVNLVSNDETQIIGIIDAEGDIKVIIENPIGKTELWSIYSDTFELPDLIWILEQIEEL